jgi:predicted ATPase
LRVAAVKIENFRGIRSGSLRFGKHPVLIGDNNAGKTTVIEALALVLGRDRLIRELTEHDFFGSHPQAADRIKIIATVTDFAGDDPERSSHWFREGRAVVKWLDEVTGTVHPNRSQNDWKLCCQIAVQARFDHESLSVDVVRYFHDHEDDIDPFVDDAPAQVPRSLIQELSFYLIRASRSWDKVLSWGSELFRRTVLSNAAQPADALLAERERLRKPVQPIEEDPAIKDLIGRLNHELSLAFQKAPKVQLRLTGTDSASVMDAVTAHFTRTNETAIPANRQGSGLVSLQGLLLLLELGRARADAGGEFVVALEEPEIHLPPSSQQRLIHRIQSLSTQTFVTTHSPLVASMADPTSVMVLQNCNGILTAEPLLEAPLPAQTHNWKRKLFQHSRVDLLSALMQPTLMIPEGRADFHLFRCLLKPLMMSQRWTETMTRSFPTEVGVIPTEEAKVIETFLLLRRLHPRVVCIVDGDAAGKEYAKELQQLTEVPAAIIRWTDDFAIEDVVQWIIDANEDAVMTKLPPVDGDRLSTSADVTRFLKARKVDIIAYEMIADAISLTEECQRRAASLFSGLANASLGTESSRFSRDAQGVWVFQA